MEVPKYISYLTFLEKNTSTFSDGRLNPQNELCTDMNFECDHLKDDMIQGILSLIEKKKQVLLN